MTDRKQAIKALLEKVEAGQIDIAPFWKVWRPEGDDWRLAWMAEGAANGSLDAAKALHEAVLPGWHWSAYDTDGLGKSNVQVEPPEYAWKPYDGIAADPARAWLIAILKAILNAEPETPASP